MQWSVNDDSEPITKIPLDVVVVVVYTPLVLLVARLAPTHHMEEE